jgi:anaerobic dimethyl sulfoxide reductase subunit B (iron-sulfur subunit)
MTQYGFYFDQSRCIGCNACTVACKQWNQLPPGPVKWMRVYQWETGSFPNIRVHFLTIPCYHCERPVCMKACPNDAIFKEDSYGVVLIDPKRCQGKRMCWKACPYGSIMFASDEPGEKASKCTMCIDRLKEVKKPICVLSCSMRAFEFGPLHELEARFGRIHELEEMPSGDLTSPSVVFKPPQTKKQIVSWDVETALKLWKSRGPHAPQGAPVLFEKTEDLTEIPPHTIGRDRLVLKAKSVEEFMYFTTDND